MLRLVAQASVHYINVTNRHGTVVLREYWKHDNCVVAKSDYQRSFKRLSGGQLVNQKTGGVYEEEIIFDCLYSA